MSNADTAAGTVDFSQRIHRDQKPGVVGSVQFSREACLCKYLCRRSIRLSALSVV